MVTRKSSADWRREFIIIINELAGDLWRDRLVRLHADAYAVLECGEMTQKDMALVEAAIVRRKARQDAALTRKVTIASHAADLVDKIGEMLGGHGGNATASAPASRLSSSQTRTRGPSLEDPRVREVRLERRRYLRDASKIPGIVKKNYTTGAVAVLEVIRREAETTGACELAVGTIAARAQCSERLVQSTTRRAKRLGHIAVVYGLRTVNRISILSKAILNWNAKGLSTTQ